MGPADILRTIKNFVGNVFARETLEERPNLRVRAEPRRQLAAMLFRGEPLALEEAPPPTSPSRGGLLRTFFGREILAEDPAPPPAPGRPGLLRALFAPEPLPELPASSPRPGRAAWLRWLFRFERLDPP